MTRYYNLIRLLKKYLTPAYKVSVVRRDLRETYGTCLKMENKFLIKINNKLSEDMAIETLLHEWAHARSWNFLHDNGLSDLHCPAWGVAYAEIYSFYESVIDEI